MTREGLIYKHEQEILLLHLLLLLLLPLLSLSLSTPYTYHQNGLMLYSRAPARTREWSSWSTTGESFKLIKFKSGG